MFRNTRNTYWLVSGAVIGSFLALPAAAQQDETVNQAARTAAQSSFEDMDTDGDGSITRMELRTAVGAENSDQLFGRMDVNGNDEISRAEWTSWRRQQQAARTADRRNQVEVGISGDTIEGWYLTDGGMVGLERAALGLGLFFSTDRHLVGQGELMIPGLLQGLVPGFLSLSAGAKAHVAFLADPDDEVFDLAPGVEARIALPFATPMAIVGSLFYAPEIFTFGDADDVWDANVRFEVQFLENLTGFAGYRFIDFDRDDSDDDEIVDSFQFGLRFAF